jgi:tRNA pseudouridine38-40 synthase
VSLVVAGRTDRGVHARGQVVSYEGPIPSLRSVNGLLPREIAVVSAEEAPDGFSARYDAISRTYRYRLHTRETRSPFELGRALWWPWPVDRAMLDGCAAALIGEHDFRAFTPSETRHRHFRRTVWRAAWDGDDLVIEADAFLRGMIRVIVGTMLEPSTTVEAFTALLDGAPRSAAGRTAPAHGLYLESVRYAG